MNLRAIGPIAALLCVAQATGATEPSCPENMKLVGSTCVDLHEWPNKIGALPFIGASAIAHPTNTTMSDATQLCASVGKRMCTIGEWRAACVGTPISKCNAHKRWRPVNWSAVARRDFGGLDQRDEIGAFPECVSTAGISDTLGSVEELVTCDGPHGVCQVGGFWATVRNCQAAIENHGARWHGYHTGFRCCTYPSPQPPPAVVSTDGTSASPPPHQTPTGPPLSAGTLERVLWVQLSTEVPRMRRGTSRRAREWQRYLLGFSRLAAARGAPGLLVDPESDALILAGIAWHECRFRLKCSSAHNFGAMQINETAPLFLPHMDPRWKGITLRELKENPETNIEAGYAILLHHKKKCGGTLIDWLTAYRSGHCHRPDANARMRHKTIDELIGYARGFRDEQLPRKASNEIFTYFSSPPFPSLVEPAEPRHSPAQKLVSRLSR